MEDRFPLRTLSEQAGDPNLFPPRVHDLHEAGRVQEALNALRAHLKDERNAVRQARQQEHADNPYLWLQPARGEAPSLYTLNGIGTMLYGHYKPDGQGNYIATQWFTFVFLPIWPLSAWVVRKAENGGWYFLAHAPLPPVARGARVFASVVAAGLVLVAAGFAVLDRTHTSLLLYNGHDVPLQAVIGEQVVEVPPHGTHEAGRFRATGALGVSARLTDGTVIEEQTIELGETAGSTVVWNMNQRGLLELGTVRYSQGSDSEPPEAEFLGAKSVFVIDDVDYLFEDPPAEIELPKYAKHTDRLVLGDAGAEAALRDQVRFLHAQGLREQAAIIVRAELDAHPNDRAALELSPQVLSSAQELHDHSAQLRERAPDEVEVHRYYQNVRPDQREALLAEYATLLEAHRDSPMHWYLHGRLLPDGDPRAMAAFQQALLLDPEFSYAHLAIGHQLLRDGQARAAADALAKFATDAEAALQVLNTRLRALHLASGDRWNPEVAEAFTSAESLGVAPSEIVLRRLLIRSHAGDGAPDELFALVDDEIDSDPTEAGASNVKAWLAFTHRDLVATHEHLRAAGADADVTLALLLVLSGDGTEVTNLLNTHANALMVSSPDFAAITVAAAISHKLPMAEALAGQIPAPIDPTVPAALLAPGISLSTRDALEARVAPIQPDDRAVAYTVAALLLRSGPVAEHARKQAVAWGLPWEVPAW